MTQDRMTIGEAMMIADTLAHNPHPRKTVQAAADALFWSIEVSDKHGDYVPQSYRWAHDALTEYLSAPTPGGVEAAPGKSPEASRRAQHQFPELASQAELDNEARRARAIYWSVRIAEGVALAVLFLALFVIGGVML